MKFTNLIVLIAITGLAVNAKAASEGTLRRATTVAQNDGADTSRTIAQQNTVSQPVTVVEAAPAAESKAEVLRKARQDAEVQTEQKIVEKLEDSRLQEEKARADRLFGNKMDAQPVVVAPVPAPAPAVAPPPPAPAPVPVVTQIKEDKPTQVNIEKVEIIEPVRPDHRATGESKLDNKQEDDEQPIDAKYYVGGLLGNLSYQANNVHSNYGLGVTVGTILEERFAIDLTYMYSNHSIDDIWQPGFVYHKLDQSDISVAAKYYLLPNKLKPYIGASLSYVQRKYTDMYYSSQYNYGYGYNNGNYSAGSVTTQAVDMGALVGLDYELSKRFLLGAGLDYNFNVMMINNPISNYIPSGGRQLEKIDYYTFKITGKFVF